MSSPLKRSTSDMVASSLYTTPPQTKPPRRPRSYSDGPSPCPSLLSEHVDEDVERFMTLPPPQITAPFCFDKDEGKNHESTTRKRNLFDDFEDERNAYESAMARRQRSFGQYYDRSNLPSLPSSQFDSSPRPPKLARRPSVANHQDEVEEYIDGSIDQRIIEEQSKILSQFQRGTWEQRWNDKHEADTYTSPVASLPRTEAFQIPDNINSDLLIEEQKVLLAQIRRERQRARMHNNDRKPSAAVARRKDSTIHNARNQPTTQPPKQPYAVGIQANKKDHVQVYPGQNVRILDRSHAMAALRENNAGMFQCAGCETHLIANKDSKVLFCSDCGTLTPTSISGNLQEKKSKK